MNVTRNPSTSDHARSALDCASPLALSEARATISRVERRIKSAMPLFQKRQRTAALQGAAAQIHTGVLCLGFLFFITSIAASHAEEIQGLVLPFKLVSVSSPVLQDIIAETFVEEGDTVKEGQMLARLESEKEQLEVDQYAKLIERKAFEAKGMETLYKEKMTSQDSALEKQTDLELAKIQHKLALARLREKTIVSPLSGIVVKKYKEVGEGIDRVEKLFDIVNIDKVFVQFYLDPKLLEHIKPEAKVTVRFAVLPRDQQQYVGSISFIDPRIDAASGLFRVKVLIDNPQHAIKAGMRGGADFSALHAEK
jgi:membrane fusion protein, multidrug efflux system